MLSNKGMMEIAGGEEWRCTVQAGISLGWNAHLCHFLGSRRELSKVEQAAENGPLGVAVIVRIIFICWEAFANWLKVALNDAIRNENESLRALLQKNQKRK